MWDLKQPVPNTKYLPVSFLSSIIPHTHIFILTPTHVNTKPINCTVQSGFYLCCTVMLPLSVLTLSHTQTHTGIDGFFSLCLASIHFEPLLTELWVMAKCLLTNPCQHFRTKQLVLVVSMRVCMCVSEWVSMCGREHRGGERRKNVLHDNGCERKSRALKRTEKEAINRRGGRYAAPPSLTWAITVTLAALSFGFGSTNLSDTLESNSIILTIQTTYTHPV